jgi:hypothetical protein
MNMLLATRGWNAIKGKLREKLAHLTEDEFQFIEEDLVNRIRKRKIQDSWTNMATFQPIPPQTK